MDINLKSSDEDLIEKFFSLKNRNDICDLLEIDSKTLIYILYRNNSNNYKTFTIPKKSGEIRKISTPITSLKILQKKLNYIFQLVGKTAPSAHGFINERSIFSNAKHHIKKRYVFNIDLENFFPSINFGRVRGLFMAYPYNLPEEIATTLAQLCIYNNELPQGAPTSPMISNMICLKMDSQLIKLAYDMKCYYSRYADDITFSTRLKKFPEEIAYKNESEEIVIGYRLKKIIKDNNFNINYSKVRLQDFTQRQEVTGLTVNQFPNVQRTYIRNIRAMLHSWEKYGLEKAEQEYLVKYNVKNKEYATPCFQNIVKGKINYVRMVKGENNQVYQNLAIKYNRLAGGGFPDYLANFQSDPYDNRLQIYTEGNNTEHIKKAIQILVPSLVEKIHITTGIENKSGKHQMQSAFQHLAVSHYPGKYLFIWDCDAQDSFSKVNETDTVFKFIFDKNENNKVAQKGIENLYPELLFDDDVYIFTELKKEGCHPIPVPEFSKTKFISKVLQQTDKDIFENFMPLIDKINSIIYPTE